MEILYHVLSEYTSGYSIFVHFKKELNSAGKSAILRAEKNEQGGKHHAISEKAVCLFAAVCLLAGCFCLTASAQTAAGTGGEECTGIYVGKKVSADGTTVIARRYGTHP